MPPTLIDMRRKAFLLILLVFFAFSSAYSGPVTAHTHAPDTLDARLYNHAKNAPPDISDDLDKLVDYLRHPAANKRDIVKAFSYWIMQNISYDINGFLTNTFNNDGVSGTLKRKIGVCQDYSELFKAMCDRAGIQCYVIPGYAKGFGYKPGNRFDKSNHAWNVIWLDNNYWLLDLTWSSGYVEYVDDAWRFTLHTDITQFLSSPEDFVEKHLPADPKWQLLHYPVSMKNFMKFERGRDMLTDSSHYFSFADSISSFEKLDPAIQELKAAEDAYRFYPVIADYAYHYYNQAVTLSNAATDNYNSAVTSYNKSVTESGTPKASGDYNATVVSNAINNYSKAINLLKKIGNYSDSEINTRDLLDKCQMGLDASNELMKTLK